MNLNPKDNYDKKVENYLNEQLELNGTISESVPVEVASSFVDEAIIEVAWYYENQDRYN